MEANPMTIGIILLIINGGVQWIRELRKPQPWKKNGFALKEIKQKLDCVDKKVGETKVAVDAQKEQCVNTVTRFDKTISDQNRELIKLAGRKR